MSLGLQICAVKKGLLKEEMENKYGEPIRAENRVKNTGIVRAGWKRNWFGVYMEGYTVTA